MADSYSNGRNSIAIGKRASIGYAYENTFGMYEKVKSTESDMANSIAIGKNAAVSKKNTIMIGSYDKNNVIDKTTNCISGLADAANNDEAVKLGQMTAAINAVFAGSSSIKYKANNGTTNRVALTTSFEFKGDNNIQIIFDSANFGVVNYKLNPTLPSIRSITGSGTGVPLISINAPSDSTPGNVSINSNQI